MKLKLNLYNFVFGIFLTPSLSVQVHSQDSTKVYSSYTRNAVCNPSSYIRHPKTEQDVVDIVKEAIATNKTVKAFGVRHSQTDIICTDGIPIDIQGLQFFQMNEDGITATFGAGVNLREATTFLRNKGRGLRTTPAYGNITIGGAIGTGAHGSTIKYNASISSQVIGMRIVDGKGDIQNITDPEDLKAFKIHLGLLGIILKVTLDTVPLYKTLASNYYTSDDILTNGKAIQMAQNTDQISLYWFPAFNEVVVANWTIIDVNTLGNAFTYDHVPSIYENVAIITATVKESAFSLTASTCALANSVGYKILHVISYFMELALVEKMPEWVPIYTEDGHTLEMPAVGFYDLMFAPICYDTPHGTLKEACVWNHGPNNLTILDNEFGLDLAVLPEFIKDVKDIITKTPTAFPLKGVLMRFSDKSDIYMSTAYGRQTVHFEFYLWKRKDPYNEPSGSLAGYQTILQLLREKYYSRSHWGKSGLVYHTTDSLKLKLDPIARQKFIAAMDKFDPNEVFINNFGRRIKNSGTKVDFDPLITRCALLDNCFCSKNQDCGENQICTTISEYNYNVCKTRNEIAPVPISKSILPKGNELMSFIFSEVETITKALLNDCSLNALTAALANRTSNAFSTFIGGLGHEVGGSFSRIIGDA